MESMDIHTPVDWQQVHNLTLWLLQGQQAQLDEIVWMWTQEAKAWIRLFSPQQELSEKIEAQQVGLGREGDGPQFPIMTLQDDVEAYLEAFEITAVACKWDPSSWAVRIGPLLIGTVQEA